VFVVASLLVTFIALTAALLRALQLMRQLATCTDAESKCLFNVQRFVYMRFMRHFVKVDMDLLEIQATGICQDFASSGGISLRNVIEQDLGSSNVITAEVRLTPPVNLTSCEPIHEPQSGNMQKEFKQHLKKIIYDLLLRNKAIYRLVPFELHNLMQLAGCCTTHDFIANESM
jgi:hypothetical protein